MVFQLTKDNLPLRRAKVKAITAMIDRIGEETESIDQEASEQSPRKMPTPKNSSMEKSFRKMLGAKKELHFKSTPVATTDTAETTSQDMTPSSRLENDGGDEAFSGTGDATVEASLRIARKNAKESIAMIDPAASSIMDASSGTADGTKKKRKKKGTTKKKVSSAKKAASTAKKATSSIRKTMKRQGSPHKNRRTFPVKLFDLLENEEYQDAICWSSSGKSIVIVDKDRLESILPKAGFAFSQLRSLHRQFSYWCFSRVKSYNDVRCLASGRGSRDGGRMISSEEWYHPAFRRGMDRTKLGSVVRISDKGLPTRGDKESSKSFVETKSNHRGGKKGAKRDTSQYGTSSAKKKTRQSKRSAMLLQDQETAPDSSLEGKNSDLPMIPRRISFEVASSSTSPNTMIASPPFLHKESSNLVSPIQNERKRASPNGSDDAMASCSNVILPNVAKLPDSLKEEHLRDPATAFFHTDALEAAISKTLGDDFATHLLATEHAFQVDHVHRETENEEDLRAISWLIDEPVECTHGGQGPPLSLSPEIEDLSFLDNDDKKDSTGLSLSWLSKEKNYSFFNNEIVEPEDDILCSCPIQDLGVDPMDEDDCMSFSSLDYDAPMFGESRGAYHAMGGHHSTWLIAEV